MSCADSTVPLLPGTNTKLRVLEVWLAVTSPEVETAEYRLRLGVTDEEEFVHKAATSVMLILPPLLATKV